MKGNKGITLIALVITIIVLLILAAVSIAMLSGDNSILGRSSQAKVANALGAAKDEVNIDATEALAKYYESVYNSNGVSGEYKTSALDEAVVKGVIGGKAIATDLDTTDVSGAWSGTGTNAEITLTYKPDSSTVKGKLVNGKITWEPIIYAGQKK